MKVKTKKNYNHISLKRLIIVFWTLKKAMKIDPCGGNQIVNHKTKKSELGKFCVERSKLFKKALYDNIFQNKKFGKNLVGRHPHWAPIHV